MNIKKPTILLSKCLSTHSFAPCVSISNTSSHTHSTSPRRCHNQHIYSPAERRRQGYATIASDGTEDYSHLRWPDAPQGHRHPTPYQIFCLQQTDAYSKQRFYELVKLYHPDRSGSQPTDSSILPTTHPCRNIPPTTKLERYRLIIAAHGILSDPEKRRAYDSFGAGWSGMPDAVTRSNNWGRANAHGTRPGPFSGWREHSDPDIWGNATWEDWERFYARRDPTHPSYQAPQYLRNSYFITVVMMLALLGSSANYGRAEKNGEHFLEARDAMHDRASKELRKVRQQSESRHKEERIQFFLRQREATMMGVGVEDVRRDRLAKLLPEQENCMPEDLRSKDWEDETRSDDP